MTVSQKAGSSGSRESTIARAEKLLEWGKKNNVRVLPCSTTHWKKSKDEHGRDKWDGGKSPLGRKWQTRDIKPEEFVYESPDSWKHAYVKPGELRNYSFQLGYPSGWLADLDLDCDEAVEAAEQFFGDIGGIEYGRGGRRTHILFRLSDPDENTAAQYVSQTSDGNGGTKIAIEFKTGCKFDEQGEPVSMGMAAMVGGKHPDTGEEMEFFGWDPISDPKPIPAISLADALGRLEKLESHIGAKRDGVFVASRSGSTRRSSSPKVDAIREALPSISMLAGMFAGDSSYYKRGNQQCPFCCNGGTSVLETDDSKGVARCYWEPCESRKLSAGGVGFDIFQMIAAKTDLSSKQAIAFLTGEDGKPDEASIADLAAFAVASGANNSHMPFAAHSKASASDKKLVSAASEKASAANIEDLKEAIAAKAQANSKRSRTSTNNQEKKERTVETMKDRFLYCHGRLYETFDDIRWKQLPSDHQLEVQAVETHSELNGGEHVSVATKNEIRELVKVASTPPADSVDLVPLHQQGKSVNLETGELLTGIPFRDCVLRIEDDGTKTFSERTLEELWVTEIPHDYPKEASPTPSMDKFVDEFSRGVYGDSDEFAEDRQLLRDSIYAMLGCCLVDNRFERMFTPVGPAGTGKSVLMGIAEGMVGKDNYIATNTDSLIGRFHIATLRTGKVIALPEMNKRSFGINASGNYDKAMAVLKAITGRDTITMEEKFVQKSFSAKCDGVVIAGMNTISMFPSYGEEPGAWKRRLVPIPSPTVPPEKIDKFLADRIVATEMPGIIYEALRIFCECCEKDDAPLHGISAIPMCSKSVELRDEAVTDELQTFLTQFRITMSQDDMIFYSELKGLWQAWQGKDGDSEVKDFRNVTDGLVNKGAGRKTASKLTNPETGKRERYLFRVVYEGEPLPAEEESEDSSPESSDAPEYEQPDMEERF